MTYIDKKKMERVMLEKCFSTASLAEKTGVSPTTIADMKNGKRNPRPETIKKVTEALGVTPGEILVDE